MTFEAAAAAMVLTKKTRDLESLKDKLRFIAGVKYKGKPVGKLPVSQIKADVIQHVIETKRKLGKTNGGMQAATHRPVSEATLNRYLSAIKVVLNHAHKREWLDFVPRIEMLDENNESFIYLTHEEAAALLAELPTHLEVMARFALATGLRRANVTHLTWKQVDMKRGVAWVNEEDSKSGEAIPIPLSDDAVAILAGQQGQHAVWCFPYEGRPVERTFTAAFKKALARAGIDKPVRWHTFRHTWATWHVMAGTPLGELMKLGGWHSLDMVMRYAKFAPGHLRQFANNSQLQIGDKQPEFSATTGLKAA